MTNALALVKKGLLWAVCCGVLSGGGAFAGNTGIGNGGDALKSTSSVAQRVSPVPTFNNEKTGKQADLKAAASEKNVANSITFTTHRQPVNHARVRIVDVSGKYVPGTGSTRTDTNGVATVSLPEGLVFKFELKVRNKTYITPVYTAPVSVTFDPFNTAPIASDVETEGLSGAAIPVPLIATDAENDALTYTYSQPANGTLSGTAPNLTYTSTAGFSGTDTFIYSVSDGIAESEEATVSVNVTARPFIISVNANDGTFTIPLKSGLTYDFVVTYDGQTITHTTDSDLTLTFPSGPGVYDVAITGTFPGIYFNNAGDKAKLLDIKQWGNIKWQTMESAFDSCSNAKVSATDTPNVSAVTNMNDMFWKCRSIDSIDVSAWDVSNVTSMIQMFRGCTGITSYIGITTWDVSNVTTMHRMFYFNRSLPALDLTGWDTSSSTDMSYMFYRCDRLANFIGYQNWDVSKVTSFRLMFERCRLPSLDFSNWNTSDVLIDIRQMFAGATVPEIKGLEDFDVTNIIFADGMFNTNAFVMTTEEYDTLLINWAAEVTAPALTQVTFDVGSVQYTPFSAAAAARASLIANNWIINDGGSAVGVDQVVAESITSPVRVSGWLSTAQDNFMISTGGAYQPVTAWGETLWYSDVTLSTTGAVPVTVKYNDTVVKSQAITWTPTLINDDTSQSVTIRKGNSLLFGSAVQTGTLLEIDTDGDGVYDLSGAPTDTFPVEYPEYGAFEVTTRIDGSDIGYLLVSVPQIIFPENVACEIGFTRELTVLVPDESPVVFKPLNSAELRVTVANELTLPGVVKLFITPLKSGTPTIVANDVTGSTLETKVVDEFDLIEKNTRFLGVVLRFEDGSFMVESIMTLLPQVKDLDVRLHIFKFGITFDDSTIDQTISTNDFIWDDEMGRYLFPFRMIMPPDLPGGICHTIKIYQNGIQVGQ